MPQSRCGQRTKIFTNPSLSNGSAGVVETPGQTVFRRGGHRLSGGLVDLIFCTPGPADAAFHGLVAHGHSREGKLEASRLSSRWGAETYFRFSRRGHDGSEVLVTHGHNRGVPSITPRDRRLGAEPIHERNRP
jgi:hypothetical protein